MKKAIDVFKAINNKNEELIKLASGFVALLLGSISFFTKILESKYNIILFLIGLFIVTQIICKELIKSKRESFGVTTDTYSTKTIHFSKLIRYASWCLLFFPAFVSIKAMLPSKGSCTSPNPELGILISNFTKTEDDDFSYKLFTTLESELQGIDTIKSIKTDQFISLNQTNRTDSLTQFFSSQCISHGLLVFGKRSEYTRLFDCNILIHNLKELNTSIDISKHNILFLRNPDLVNFSLDSQANIISDFILGLLFYNSNNYDYSISRFQQVLRLNSSFDHSKVNSFCHLFIGNSLVQQKKITEAINTYKAGANMDSLNAFLHYNLGIALTLDLDSLSGYNEFEKANSLNPKFPNPIKEIFHSLKNKGEKEIITSQKLATILPTTPIKSQAEKVNEKSNTVYKQTNSSEYSIFSKGSKYGVINSKKDTVIPCVFDSIDPNIFNYKNFKFFVVQRNGKYGAMKANGYLEVPTIHPSVDYVRAILKTTIDLAPETINH